MEDEPLWICPWVW